MAQPSAPPAPLAGRTMRLILNAKASEDLALREAVDVLRQQGHDLSVRVIWEPGDARVFAAEAAGQGAAVVIAAGGDGTVNEAIHGLFLDGEHPACALGVLPYGTANDFAAACGVPLQDPLAALQLIAAGPPVMIDVGRVNDRLFINVASGGYAAQVTTETRPEAKQILGPFAYFLTGLASVTEVVARPTRLTAPDFHWEGEILGITVGNGRQAGGGFRVAPDALLDDGLLDVMIIPNVGWSELASLAHDLMHLDDRLTSEHLIYHQCPWLQIDAPEGLQVNVDGEPLYGSSFRFEALARRLPCCLPTTAPLCVAATHSSLAAAEDASEEGARP